MSTYTSKNSFGVLIGKTGAFEALDTVQLNDSTLGTYIDDGQIVVLDSTGAVLTPGDTITDSPNIQLVQRSGATLVYSNRIEGLNVMSYTGKSGVAGQDQIYVLGYNGTSGSIDVTQANTFTLNITYTHDWSMWSEQQNHNVATYTAVGTPIQANIAAALASQLIFGQYPRGGTLLKVERLANDAGAAVTGTATTWTVANGSTMVIANGTVTNVVAGDYVRLGGLTTAFAVYKVVSITSGATSTIILDAAYQGASVALTEATEVELITSALGQVADWGIKFSGQALTFGLDPYGVFPFMRMTFNIGNTGFGATILTKTQEASLGNGVYEEVAQRESFAVGFDGALNRNIHPFPLGRRDAVSGVLYDTIFIKFADTTDTSVICGIAPSLMELYIFSANTAAQTSILLGQLDPWMASTPKQFTAIGAL